MLYIMGLETTLLQIKRILKDNGLLLFLLRKPTGTKPFFQFYRKSIHKYRSDDEKSFTSRDLKLVQSHYSLEDVNWYGFSSIVSAFLRLDLLRIALSSIDHVLSKTPLKYLYWQFAGVARKKTNSNQLIIFHVH